MLSILLCATLAAESPTFAVLRMDNYSFSGWF